MQKYRFYDIGWKATITLQYWTLLKRSTIKIYLRLMWWCGITWPLQLLSMSHTPNTWSIIIVDLIKHQLHHVHMIHIYSIGLPRKITPETIIPEE